MHADFSFTTLDDEIPPTIHARYFDEQIHCKLSHPNAGTIYFILTLDEATTLMDQLNVALMDRDYQHGDVPR